MDKSNNAYLPVATKNLINQKLCYVNKELPNNNEILTGTEVHLYEVILMFAKKEKGSDKRNPCTVKAFKLASYLNTSRSTISRSLTKLEKCKLIKKCYILVKMKGKKPCFRYVCGDKKTKRIANKYSYEVLDHQGIRPKEPPIINSKTCIKFKNQYIKIVF